jgi:hypothetical protein
MEETLLRSNTISMHFFQLCKSKNWQKILKGKVGRYVDFAVAMAAIVIILWPLFFQCEGLYNYKY